MTKRTQREMLESSPTVFGTSMTKRTQREMLESSPILSLGRL